MMPLQAEQRKQIGALNAECFVLCRHVCLLLTKEVPKPVTFINQLFISVHIPQFISIPRIKPRLPQLFILSQRHDAYFLFVWIY